MLPPLNRRLAAADLVAEACRSTKRSRDVGANASECEALQPARADVRNFDAGIAALPWVRSAPCCDPVVVSDELVLQAQSCAHRRRSAQSVLAGLSHGDPSAPGRAHGRRPGWAMGRSSPSRPIRPEDAELERAFVHGLSDQSRFFRFSISCTN